MTPYISTHYDSDDAIRYKQELQAYYMNLCLPFHVLGGNVGYLSRISRISRIFHTIGNVSLTLHPLSRQSTDTCSAPGSAMDEMVVTTSTSSTVEVAVVSSVSCTSPRIH